MCLCMCVHVCTRMCVCGELGRVVLLFLPRLMSPGPSGVDKHPPGSQEGYAVWLAMKSPDLHKMIVMWKVLFSKESPS